MKLLMSMRMIMISYRLDFRLRSIVNVIKGVDVDINVFKEVRQDFVNVIMIVWLVFDVNYLRLGDE